MSAQLPSSARLLSDSGDRPFQYRGHELLDLLREAENYNSQLARQVIEEKPPRARKIVDLGAGRGTFAELLRAQGLGIDCVELDPENQARLRERGFTVQSTLAEHLAGSIDYVYTLNVLEHVPEDEELIRMIFSRLRSGGRLFVFVPAFPVLWSWLDDYVEHRRRYRRAPLEAMLRRSGFVGICSRYADSLGFFAAFFFGRSGRPRISSRNIWIYDRLLFPISRFLDPVLGRFFGKNLLAVCEKP